MNTPLRTRLAFFSAACAATFALLVGLNAMFVAAPLAVSPASAAQPQLASASAAHHA